MRQYPRVAPVSFHRRAEIPVSLVAASERRAYRGLTDSYISDSKGFSGKLFYCCGVASALYFHMHPNPICTSLDGATVPRNSVHLHSYGRSLRLI